MSSNEAAAQKTSCCSTSSAPDPKSAPWYTKFKIEKAWLASAVILGVLAVVVPEQLQPSAVFVWDAVLGILPFLLLAVASAAYAGASGADNLIAKAFSGHIAVMVLVAASFGALSPFCSCGVIPLIAALLAMGVPLAPVMAFWLASPLMDPTMFFVTSGELGMDFAIAKTMAAFGVGLMGGYGTLILSSTPLLTNPLREGVGNGGCGASTVRAPKAVHWAFWQDPARRQKFWSEGLKSALFLLKWLVLAYLLESLMVAYVPPSLIADVAGDGGLLSIFVASLIGVPAYLNGYAAVPLVSGLIQGGMAPGAGMAFLIAGGVTSLPAAIAVYALARLPVFGLYLAFSLGGATLVGLLFQAWAV
ncbi:permease [Magnetovibrio sp. PR-2]|uniref:permease n=1 Tax=Magnetovibrio sp. PR-2 TaxID=3120356 RepID=UPI002FCDF3A6